MFEHIIMERLLVEFWRKRFVSRITHTSSDVGQLGQLDAADVPQQHFADRVVGVLALVGRQTAIQNALGHADF